MLREPPKEDPRFFKDLLNWRFKGHLQVLSCQVCPSSFKTELEHPSSPEESWDPPSLSPMFNQDWVRIEGCPFSSWPSHGSEQSCSLFCICPPPFLGHQNIVGRLYLSAPSPGIQRVLLDWMNTHMFCLTPTSPTATYTHIWHFGSRRRRLSWDLSVFYFSTKQQCVS